MIYMITSLIFICTGIIFLTAAFKSKKILSLGNSNKVTLLKFKFKWNFALGILSLSTAILQMIQVYIPTMKILYIVVDILFMIAICVFVVMLYKIEK